MKKNSQKILVITIVLLFFFLIYAFIVNVYAYPVNNLIKNDKNVYYKNSKPLDLESIITENTKVKKVEKIIANEIDVEYTTLYKENEKMPVGVYRVVQMGEDGKQNAIIKQSFEDDVLLKEELVSTNVSKNSIEKIIEIGTGKGYLNQEIKKGDKVYVSVKKLELKQSSDIISENIENLKYNQELKVLKIYDNSFLVETENNQGYILKEGVSKYNPEKDYAISGSDTAGYSKEELLSKLDFNMDVSVQSNLTLEQFEAIFENNSNDKNGILKENAKYFYYAEEQYNINGVFLAAIAVHESAWGTSAIARNKNNLFGYCAYDNDPYNSAQNFASCSEGIDLVARVLMKNYLNEPGTVLSDGTTASGRFFSGKTIKSVNLHYATDKNWANCVYKWMKNMYNSIP